MHKVLAEQLGPSPRKRRKPLEARLSEVVEKVRLVGHPCKSATFIESVPGKSAVPSRNHGRLAPYGRGTSFAVRSDTDCRQGRVHAGGVDGGRSGGGTLRGSVSYTFARRGCPSSRPVAACAAPRARGGVWERWLVLAPGAILGGRVAEESDGSRAGEGDSGNSPRAEAGNGRRGLVRAADLRLGPIELELGVQVSDAEKYKGQVKVWVVSVGSEHAFTDVQTHRLKLTLAPAERGRGRRMPFTASRTPPGRLSAAPC